MHDICYYMIQILESESAAYQTCSMQYMCDKHDHKLISRFRHFLYLNECEHISVDQPLEYLTIVCIEQRPGVHLFDFKYIRIS